MLEWKIMVKLFQLVTALLTVMSKGSPVPLPPTPQDSELIEAPSLIDNQTTSWNASDLPLLNGSLYGDQNNTAIQSSTAEDDESCEMEPFCEIEKHPVPDDVQLKILERNFDRLRPFFQKDPEDIPEMYRTPILFDKDDEFIQACDTKSWTIDRPKKVRDVDGVRHFLLNPELGGYRQSISLLRCSDELQPCRNIEHHVPPSRPTKCETRSWRRQMTAINEETFEPYEITVQVPAACNCFIKSAEFYSVPLREASVSEEQPQ